LFALLQILEGDLLLPVPSWVSYIPQAKLAGKRVCPIQTDPTDRLAMSVPALSNALYEARRAGADPRILLLNSPNNPTGGMFDRETASAIAAWAEEEGLVLISDEIYAELAHGSRKHLSPATFNPHNAIITGGISKSFSAGGWRLGYAALPRGSERVFAALEAMASEVWSAATMPVQQAAIVALGDDPDIHAYLKASAFLHGRVTRALHTALTGLGVHCPRPFGGFYLYPDFGRWRQELIQRGVRTADDLALHLLEKWGIASLPGTQFGDRPENLCLRLSTSMLHDTESGAGQRAFWNVVAHMRNAADNHREPIVNPCPQLDETYRRFTQFISSMES
jgi:aspartate/methionine/tyrosine aminotransferase